MLNVLYGLITNGAVAEGIYSWYGKTCDNPLHTERIDNIRNVLVADIPEEKLNFFACVVCSMVMETAFEPEILKYDANNTYSKPSRPPGKPHSDPNYSFQQFSPKVSVYKRVKGLLDKDLADKAAGGNWLDWFAAGCVQMLREVYR